MKQIKISQGFFALVDDEDFEKISQHTWCAKNCNGKIYAFYSNGIWNGKRGIYMHRFILDVKDPKISVDHKDGHTLNNQKWNLRICTQSQNVANSKTSVKNTSGYRGVYWHKDAKKFMAYFKHKNKMYNLGLFKDPKEAAKKRDAKVKEVFGEFGVLNFPENTMES